MSENKEDQNRPVFKLNAPKLIILIFIIISVLLISGAAMDGIGAFFDAAPWYVEVGLGIAFVGGILWSQGVFNE